MEIVSKYRSVNLHITQGHDYSSPGTIASHPGHIVSYGS